MHRGSTPSLCLYRTSKSLVLPSTNNSKYHAFLTHSLRTPDPLLRVHAQKTTLGSTVTAPMNSVQPTYVHVHNHYHPP